MTIELPIIGYFADGVSTYKWEEPEVEDIDLEAIQPTLFGDSAGRPFKSFVVEFLAKVRDDPRVASAYSGNVCVSYSVAHGLVVPTSMRLDHPGWGSVVYELTQLGREFLETHEAPECWA